MRNINNVTLCPAGLPDMVLSALLQEQVEGLTAEAIAMMSPKKMAVSFICHYEIVL